MAIINKAAFAKALWPGIQAWYGKEYSQHEEFYKKMFDTSSSEKAFEEDVSISSFGLAPQKPEGQAVSYDTEQQGFITRFTHITYGLGFIVTDEAIEDDQYMVIAENRARALAFSMRTTKEIVAADIYNRAFTGGPTYGDGVSLLNSAHPNVAGGTWSNILATPSDLNEAALEQACIDIMRFKNDRGLNIAVLPSTLIVSPDDAFNAMRILQSPLQSHTANNALNALKASGKFLGEVVVNPYLAVPSGGLVPWFVRTNVPNGMKHLERRPDSFTEDNDFDTDNLKYKATARYSFGATDPRGLFGSPGA